MPRVRKELVESAKRNRQDEIAYFNYQLVDCTEEMGKIQGLMASCEDANERASLGRQLALELKKKSLLIEKLARLKRAKKRGRPKKAPGQGYQENRVKFTAWLLPENFSYVKELKDRKEIANVSGFLDALIEEHRNRG